MKKLFFFGATFLLSSLSAHAVDFLVQTGEDSDPKWEQNVIETTGATLIDLKVKNQTIDAALTAAITTNKQEIWFAGGTYTFAAAYANKNGTQFIGGFAGTETTKDSRVLTEGGEAYDFQYETILDGGKTVQLFSAAGAANTTLDGLTLQNSKSAANAGVARLGSTATVKNCQFIGNTAANQGGAIQFYNANATISNCYFEGDTATQGGAIYVNNTAANEITITNCAFIGNLATGTANAGGAIHVQKDGKVIVQNCYFTENDAKGNGAAISFAGTNEANTIQNCLIYANKGGAKHAVYMAAGNFYYNTVVENEGGALYSTKCNCKNNVFWGTETAKGSIAANKTECVFDYNAAVDSLNGGNAVVSNHIALSVENTGTEADVNYPKFANVESGDFTIQKGSALINAGTTIEGITTDLVGETRTQADLGAFAYIASAPTGIDEAKTEAVDIEAALRAGEVYDLLGRRVGKLQTGNVYLLQGAKVLINK